MIVPDFISSCERAKPFYYNLLFAEAPEPVPTEVRDHISTCEYCREEMNCLKDALSSAKTGDNEGPLRNYSLINKSLNLQFSLTDQEVTCTLAKPFLVILNLEGMETNIPTPITTHFDQCPTCAAEFETIQKLTLNQSQLRRLAQLFSETVRPDSELCADARDRIPRLAAMEPADCAPELLDHICQCRVCRELYYNVCWDRFRMLSESSYQSDIECDRNEASEIFNLAVPYGLKAEDVEKMFLPDSPVSHIKGCPICMKKLRDLQRVIYPILDRQGFGVTTRFRIAESKREETDNEKSRELYRDWPIEVTEVESPEISKEITIPKERSEASQKEKRKSYTWLLQKRITYPAAVAAIVLIALSLIFYATPVTAISIDQVRAALVKIDAIHISKWEPDSTEPIQETWISRPANLYLNKTGNIVVYWDFTNKGTRTEDLSTGTIEFKAAAPESLEKTRLYMKGALGLVPSSGLSDALRNATWQRITVEAQETKTVATEVYELEWKDSGYGSTEILRKWRGYIDPETHLPQKIEWYMKTPNDNGYILESTCTVEYLSNAEIQTVINQYLP